MAFEVRELLETVSFAARAHRHQLRKDGQTPYFAHPVRVCLIMLHVFGVTDPEALQVALLHDTIEDTTTDADDLTELAGERVTQAVGQLTKDSRLTHEAREAAYCARLVDAPAIVKLGKLADIYDNLTDSAHLSAAARRGTVAKTRRYLDAIAQNLPDAVRTPLALTEKLWTTIQATV